MANIMDFFSPAKVVETKFDIAGIKDACDRIFKMQEAVGGRPTLRAKVGSGGMKAFNVVMGNQDMIVESFQGVIIAHHQANARFAEKEEGTENMNTPPLCSSIDGKTGLLVETGELIQCENCPYNQFGSCGNGKACKNMHRLYILVQGCPIPVTLTLPPTSLELWRSYALMDVAAAGLDVNEVVTEFSLTDMVNDAGQKYCIVNFKLVGKVEKTVSDFCQEISKTIEQAPRPGIEAGDYNREEPAFLPQNDDSDETVDSTEDDLEAVTAEIVEDAAEENSAPEEVDIDNI